MSEVFIPRTLAELELQFPPELEHLSASSLKMLVRCEEQWRQRYILGRKEPPNLNLIGGSADHKAIESSMALKVESHADLPVGEVMETFVHEVETRVEREGGLSGIQFREEDDTIASRQRAYDDLRRDGQQLVAAYHNQVSKTIQPVAVEREFRIRVDGVPVELLGYIDLTTDTTVIDRKRAGRKNTFNPEWHLQAEIYQLVEPKPFEWHLSVTTKTPQIVLPGDANDNLYLALQPRERSERLVRQLVSKLGWLYRTFGPDEPWPTTGKLHTWACNYCGFRAGCWGWR